MSLYRLIVILTCESVLGGDQVGVEKRASTLKSRDFFLIDQLLLLGFLQSQDRVGVAFHRIVQFILNL